MITSINPSNNLSDGLVTYLFTKLNNFPLLTTNAQNNSITPEKMYTANVPLQFTNDKYPVNLTFDFRKFRISIQSYTLFLHEGWTPPAQWEIRGRNSINEKWSTIHLSDVDT